MVLKRKRCWSNCGLSVSFLWSEMDRSSLLVYNFLSQYMTWQAFFFCLCQTKKVYLYIRRALLFPPDFSRGLAYNKVRIKTSKFSVTNFPWQVLFVCVYSKSCWQFFPCQWALFKSWSCQLFNKENCTAVKEKLTSNCAVPHCALISLHYIASPSGQYCY
jgi:hypothetical protein